MITARRKSQRGMLQPIKLSFHYLCKVLTAQEQVTIFHDLMRYWHFLVLETKKKKTYEATKNTNLKWGRQCQRGKQLPLLKQTEEGSWSPKLQRGTAMDDSSGIVGLRPCFQPSRQTPRTEGSQRLPQESAGVVGNTCYNYMHKRKIDIK